MELKPIDEQKRTVFSYSRVFRNQHELRAWIQLGEAVHNVKANGHLESRVTAQPLYEDIYAEELEEEQFDNEYAWEVNDQ